MKRLLLIILSIALLSACTQTDPGLPSGYSVVCSVDGKKYALRISTFSGLEITHISANVFDSEIEAKKYAWKFEEYRNEKTIYDSDKYKWGECK